MSMFLFPKLYGFEYAILPAVGLPFLYYAGDFTLPAALFNNFILTAVCAATAMWRSRQIRAAVGRSYTDRLDPVWPALVGAFLAFLAMLQLILSVAHLSYYRNGAMAIDLFER
jgi:hypothetical protein